jgi:hypothetical protein
LVMMSTQRGKIAQTRAATTVVCEGMVGVALCSGASAPGESAREMPDPDQVTQARRRLVGGCFPGVIALAAVEPGESDRPHRIPGLLARPVA